MIPPGGLKDERQVLDNLSKDSHISLIEKKVVKNKAILQ